MSGLSTDLDPFEVVRERARAVVDNARSFGWSGPPFDPVQLASIEGIRARPSDGPLESDALIRALDDGTLEIVWNREAAPTRRNFSIDHELGHTLFPDAYEVVRHRSARRRNLEDELEQLCDAAAAEMLLPAEEFRQDLLDLDLSGEAVRKLAKRYVASPEATACRIATLSERACATILLTMRLKPTETRRENQIGMDFGEGQHVPTARLRVDYMVPSTTFPFWLPEHKSVPDDSCAYDAVNGTGDTIETWSTGNRQARLHVSVIEVPSDTEGRSRVLALVTPS
jgi:Zn-dependent peptidase ImmA (M78 family)